MNTWSGAFYKGGVNNIAKGTQMSVISHTPLIAL